MAVRPYLIGIAGPSCSGKSEVARRLGRILRAPVLSTDHYYRDLKHLPPEERARINFDAPESMDEPLVLEHVRGLKSGQAVDQPAYDFTHHVRAADVDRIHSAPYVLIEGLFALYWPAVRDLLDFRIYISADHDTCLARRLYRDVRERGRTEQSVRDQFATTVRPMAEKFVVPTAEHADLVLAGIAPLKQSVYTILLYMAQRLADPEVQEVITSWSPASAD